MDWHRNYAALARLLALGTELDEIVPGVTVGGVDVGRWLERQRQHVVWEGLAQGQRERLAALGITPLPPEQKTPTLPPGAALPRSSEGVQPWEAVQGANGHREARQSLPRRGPAGRE
ncbi:Helicase associated domain protein [Streptomyces sp. NPDC007251]|uniref:Helicase associated domain protein n=1 Tax=Streptomyces sp. NPDC007251 TaxID=3154483 RepID=UPI0033CE5648